MNLFKTQDRTRDEMAIRQVVQQMQDGWNRLDGAAFGQPFAGDADYVVVNGLYVRGREAIAAGHQEIFDTIYRDSHNEGAVQSIRFLRDDVAVAHVRWHLLVHSGPAKQDTQAMSTLVLTREDDRWSIAAFQNTRVQNPNDEQG